MPLHAAPILIDSDHLSIRQNQSRGVAHGSEIVAGDEWRVEQCPETEMGDVLAIRHPAVAYLEHVGIVPGVWSRIRLEADLLVEDLQH